MIKKRRIFIQKLASVFALATLNSLFNKQTAYADDLSKPMADPTTGMAKKVVYNLTHEDAEKDPKTQKDKFKLDTQWNARFCDNCKYFAEAGVKDGKKVGLCSLIPGYLVVDKGICNVWKPKS